MKHRWAALVVVLALSALMPRVGAGQGTQPAPQKKDGVTLKQNFPNPFNPTTTLAFSIDCTEDRSRTFKVSLKIYNVLAQLVAIPVLQGPASAAGRPLNNLDLPCGDYTAFWDGNYLNSTREVASGIYLSRLEVDGAVKVRKMTVMK
jgi:hypothetical protein